VEPVERAIGRVHGRRLLLRWLAKRAVGRRGVLLGRSTERPYDALTVGRPYSIDPTTNLCQQQLARTANTLSAGRASPSRIGHGIVNPLAASGRKNLVHGPKGNGVERSPALPTVTRPFLADVKACLVLNVLPASD
jgi:hypothetical protein